LYNHRLGRHTMRSPLKLLLGLFVKNNSSICGGVECVPIEGRYGSTTKMKLFYERPTSDLIISYEYDYKNLIENDAKLRTISDDKTKHAEFATRMIDVLYGPYTKKVFHHCEGFFNENEKPLEKLPKDEQFELLKKYYSFYLVDLCSIVYEVNTRCKKKV